MLLSAARSAWWLSKSQERDSNSQPPAYKAGTLPIAPSWLVFSCYSRIHPSVNHSGTLWVMVSCKGSGSCSRSGRIWTCIRGVCGLDCRCTLTLNRMPPCVYRCATDLWNCRTVLLRALPAVRRFATCGEGLDNQGGVRGTNEMSYPLIFERRTATGIFLFVRFVKYNRRPCVQY